MRKIPIFKFPLIVQSHVISYLDFVDNLILNLCSKRSKALVKYAHFKIARMEYRFHQDFNIITITTFPQRHIFRIATGESPFPTRFNYKLNDHVLKLDGRLFQMKRLHRHGLQVGASHICSMWQHKIMDFFTELILEVFEVHEHVVSSHSNNRISNFFLWTKHTTKFKKISFLKWFTRNPTIWNPTELRFFLEGNLEIDELNLDIPMAREANYQITGPLKPLKLTLRSGPRDTVFNWLDPETLINMGDNIEVFKIVNVFYMQFKDPLNDFLRECLFNGKMKNLEKFQVVFNRVVPVRHGFLEEVLEGIETIPWLEVPDWCPPSFRDIDFTEAKYIRRADGPLAAVRVVGQEFGFYVWQEKYRNATV